MEISFTVASESASKKILLHPNLPLKVQDHSLQLKITNYSPSWQTATTDSVSYINFPIEEPFEIADYVFTEPDSKEKRANLLENQHYFSEKHELNSHLIVALILPLKAQIHLMSFAIDSGRIIAHTALPLEKQAVIKLDKRSEFEWSEN